MNNFLGLPGMVGQSPGEGVSHPHPWEGYMLSAWDVSVWIQTQMRRKADLHSHRAYPSCVKHTRKQHWEEACTDADSCSHSLCLDLGSAVYSWARLSVTLCQCPDLKKKADPNSSNLLGLFDDFFIYVHMVHKFVPGTQSVLISIWLEFQNNVPCAEGM